MEFKKFLKAHKINQEVAARQMGVDRTYLNQALGGRRNIGAYFLFNWWKTYCWPRSPFVLPGASDVLDKTMQHIDQSGTKIA